MSVLLLVALVLSVAFAYTAISGAPWVPARSHDIEKLLQSLQLTPDMRYVELGCGEGRVLRAVAKTGAQAVGYELNPLLWCIAWLRCLPLPNARVRLANFWSADLGQADFVLAFLVPRTMHRLATTVTKHMKPGSRLISYVFTLPGHKPEQTVKPWLIYRMSPKQSI